MPQGEIFRTAPFRFVLALTIAFSSLVLLLFAFIYWQTAIYETNRIDGLVIAEVAHLATEPRAEIERAVNVRLSTDLHRITFAALFSPADVRIAGNLAAVPRGFAADGRVQSVAARRLDPQAASGEMARVVARRLPDGDLLVVGRNIEELTELRTLVMRALLLGLVPAVLLSLAASILLSTRSLNHIKIIHQTLKRIMRGHLQERLPTRGTRDDLDQLAYAVNGMLDEIAKLLEELRDTGGNIAHDLRQPLARLRARLERSRSQPASTGALEAVIDEAVTDLDQLSAIITALLRIGEIENASREAGFTCIALGPLLRELAELFQPIAEAADIDFTLDVTENCAVVGDGDLLMEAFVNLVDNALKFTPAGGAVRVCLTPSARGPVVRIADNGPGIPAAERASVLKRFYRSDKSRHIQGRGLGLSLVQAIARLHGFTLSIEGAPPGCVFQMLCAAPAPGPSPFYGPPDA